MAFNRKKYSLPSPGSQHFDAKVKEILEIREGVRSGQSPAFITYGDLSSIDLTSYLKNISQDKGPLIVTGGNPPQPPTNLVVTGGMLGNRLSWTPSVSSDVWYYQVWMSNTQNRGDGGVLSTVPDPQSVYVHHLNATEVLLDHYYWVRAVSWSGLYSTWEPSDAQGGYLVTGATSYAEMVDEILEKLQGQITESQLFEDLQDRIDLIDKPDTGLWDLVAKPDIGIYDLITKPDTGLLDRLDHFQDLSTNRLLEVQEKAENLTNEAAEGILDGVVSASNSLDRLRNTFTSFGGFRDAISYVDPESGLIRLYAVDATENRLSDAEILIDGVAGSIESATENIQVVDERLSTAETSILQQDARINLRATYTELDEAIAAVLEGFTPAASYQFNGTLEGWEDSVDLTTQPSTLLLDGESLHRTGLEIDGGENTLVMLRFRLLDDTEWNSSTDWVGKIQYSTSGHGFSEDYQREFAPPTNITEWYTQQVSMRDLVNGGDDWTNNEITGLKIILGTAQWEIDFIEIGKSSIEQYLYADFDLRMSAAEIAIDAQEASINLKADQTIVNNLGTRVDEVETDMDAAEAAIALRATRDEVLGVTADPVEDWQFSGDVEGWQTSGSLTHDEAEGVVQVIGSSLYRSGLGFAGADYEVVALRFKRVSGSGWDGRVQYTTSGHGFSDNYQKDIAQPANLDDWNTVYVLMSSRDEETDDWVENEITGIKVILGSGTWMIDWIIIGRTATDIRMRGSEIRLDGAEAELQLKVSSAELGDVVTQINDIEILLDAKIGAVSLRAGSTTAEGDLNSESLMEALLLGDRLLDHERITTHNFALADFQLQALSSDIEAEASARLILAGQVDGNQAALLQEQQIRVTETQALASDISDLHVMVNDNEALIYSVEEAIVGEDGAIAQATQTLWADFGEELDENVFSAIEEEKIARADADTAQSQYSMALQSGLSETVMEALLQGDTSLRDIRGNFAYARREMDTLRTDIETEASERLILVGQVENDLGEVQGLITQESIARANADGALAAQIDLLDARVGDNETDILSRATIAQLNQVEADIYGAAVESFTQINAEFSSLQGDVDLKASVTYVDQTFVTENEATAIATTQVLSEVGDSEDPAEGTLYAVVQTQAESIDGIQAKHTVKLDVNGFVSGYGLISEPDEAGEQTSAFIVNADKFAIIKNAPGELAENAKIPFVVGDIPELDIEGNPVLDENGDPVTIEGVGIDGALVVKDSIFAHSIGADQIRAFHIAANTIDGTHIRAQSDITIGQLDGVSDYIVLDGVSGTIKTHKFIAGDYRQYKSLSRRESGIANSNTTVQIPGYFESEPEIHVSINTLAAYDPAYSDQKQNWSCRAENINEATAGKWEFDVVADLVLDEASGQAAVNDETQTSNDTHKSTPVTSPENTEEITVNVKLTSIRGTGASNEYYKREVYWRIGYSNNGGTSYTYTSWQTKNVGETLSAVTDSRTLSLPSADTWTIKIGFVASDAGGTFSTGAAEYDYDSVTQTNAGPSQQDTGCYYYGPDTPGSLGPIAEVSGRGFSHTIGYIGGSPNEGEEGNENLTNWVTKTSTASSYDRNFFDGVASSQVQNDNCNDTKATTLQLPTYSPPSGWEIYHVEYSYDYAYYLYYFYTNGQTNTAEASLKLRNASATIYIRKPKTNTTTPDNTFEFVSYGYELSGATVLAGGSVNWIAIGE